MGKKTVGAPAAAYPCSPPDPPLKKQSRYSRAPWQPGEIPGGSLMTISRPHDQGETPYGAGNLNVEPPKARGKGAP